MCCDRFGKVHVETFFLCGKTFFLPLQLLKCLMKTFWDIPNIDGYFLLSVKSIMSVQGVSVWVCLPVPEKV